MGWSSIKERRDKAVLNFRLRICLVDGNRWVKRIFEWGRNVLACGICARELSGSIMRRHAQALVFRTLIEDGWEELFLE